MCSSAQKRARRHNRSRCRRICRVVCRNRVRSPRHNDIGQWSRHARPKLHVEPSAAIAMALCRRAKRAANAPRNDTTSARIDMRMIFEPDCNSNDRRARMRPLARSRKSSWMPRAHNLFALRIRVSKARTSSRGLASQSTSPFFDTELNRKRCDCATLRRAWAKNRVEAQIRCQQNQRTCA